MTYRPYPSLDRARHQLARHVPAVQPVTVRGLDALRGWSLTAEQAMANATAALRVLPTAADFTAAFRARAANGR